MQTPTKPSHPETVGPVAALAPVLTLGDVAHKVGVSVWQVRRLFERGTLPAAARVGQYRVVAEADVPAIKEALEAAGYLKSEGVNCGE
jgi:hypothetical protein